MQIITITKPIIADLAFIKDILSQWTDQLEVEKYISRVENEIHGHTEFNMHFWVAKDEDSVMGIVGLSDPLPKILHFAQTATPGELKILYVDTARQGRGVGRLLVNLLELEAKYFGYTELLVRSAQRYQDTANGFYKKMNFTDRGTIDGADSGKSMQVFQKII